MPKAMPPHPPGMGGGALAMPPKQSHPSPTVAKVRTGEPEAQVHMASAERPPSRPAPHPPAPAPGEGQGTGKKAYKQKVELGVPGRVLEDTEPGGEKLVRVLEGHSATGFRAGELAALVEANRYRLTDIGAGRLREHWDFLFGTGKSAKTFLDAARWPLQREGWDVVRKGHYIRLQRAALRDRPATPPPPAPRVEKAVEERAAEVEKRRRPRSKPDPLAELAVPGRVVLDESRGPGAMVPILERHAATRERAEELAGLVVGDRYREVDIGTERTMLHWDLRMRDGEGAKTFLDAARWPLQREGWTVARKGRILRLQMRED
jgi:hypothetical protein